MHPLFKVESSLVYIINEDRSLDIFEMVVGINEFTQKNLLRKNCSYFVDIKWMQKISNTLWNGVRNMKQCSQLLVFYTTPKHGIYNCKNNCIRSPNHHIWLGMTTWLHSPNILVIYVTSHLHGHSHNYHLQL